MLPSQSEKCIPEVPLRPHWGCRGDYWATSLAAAQLRICFTPGVQEKFDFLSCRMRFLDKVDTLLVNKRSVPIVKCTEKEDLWHDELYNNLAKSPLRLTKLSNKSYWNLVEQWLVDGSSISCIDLVQTNMPSVTWRAWSRFNAFFIRISWRRVIDWICVLHCQPNYKAYSPFWRTTFRVLHELSEWLRNYVFDLF